MAVGRQATEYTFENTPFSSDADFDFNELPAEFMEKVKEADFWEWAREYVNPRKKLFGGKIPVETVLAHTTVNWLIVFQLSYFFNFFLSIELSRQAFDEAKERFQWNLRSNIQE